MNKGGRQPVVGATPAMAEGTASIKCAGGAEKATAAKLKALEPRAYGEAGNRCEMPLRGNASHRVGTMICCLETSMRGRNTSRTSSYIEVVSDSWSISNG